MNFFNCLNKKSWLLMGLCVSLAGVVQAGTTYDTGSQGTTGTSPGTTGSMERGQEMGKIQPFQAADKNSDSYVTKSELFDSPSLLKHFDRVDVNKDGQLEENEYKNLIMENAQ